MNYLGGRFSTTGAAAIAKGNNVVVTPAGMDGIYVGEYLMVGNPRVPQTFTPAPDLETVVVHSVTATSFTADFVYNHAAGVMISGAKRGEPLAPEPNNPPGGNQLGEAIAYLQGTTDATGLARVRFSVTPQPGNDYIVLATTSNHEWVEWTQSDADGGAKGATGDPNFPTNAKMSPNTAWSSVLKVFRTLHVEQDTMVGPPDSERVKDANGNPTGKLTDGDSDPGAGPLTNVPLPIPRFTGPNGYNSAYVVVNSDLAAWNKRPVIQTWTHTLLASKDNGALGQSVRDVPTSNDFWVVQVVTMFEGAYSDEVADPLNGWSPGPVYVFAQTAAEQPLPATVDLNTQFIPRIVLHETLHRFPDMPHHSSTTAVPGPFNGQNPGDKGVLNYDVARTASNQSAGLRPDQVDLIRGELGPTDAGN